MPAPPPVLIEKQYNLVLDFSGPGEVLNGISNFMIGYHLFVYSWVC